MLYRLAIIMHVYVYFACYFSWRICLLRNIYQVRAWEKKLQQIFDETNPTKLSQAAEANIKRYLQSLPKPGRVFCFRNVILYLSSFNVISIDCP